MKHTTVALAFAMVLMQNLLFAQKKGDLYSNKIFNFQFIYNGQTAAGDWSKMYGTSSALGFGVNYKSQRNWIFSAEGSFMLSSDLKAGGANLYYLTNSNGSTFNSNNGTPATVDLTMRGFHTFAKVGKIFPLARFNKNHGFIVQAGAGFLMHYLYFNIPQSTVVQLNEKNQLGYDRLHAGLATNQFIGYYYQAENRLINFYFGIDFIQGFTKNLRGFNYDTQQYDTGNKMDNITAFRFAWMIPIYISNKNEEFNFESK